MSRIEIARKTWRPALGWSIVLIVLLEFTVMRVPALGITPLTETTIGLLLGTGLVAAGTRSFDKLKGNA